MTDAHDPTRREMPDEASDPRDPATLAAWLDGRMSEIERDPFERALADDPDARAAIRDVRALEADGAATAIFVPPGMIDAAKGLVEGRSRRTATPLVMVLRWTVAAAATVAIGFAGYHTGLTTSDDANEHDRLLVEMTFGVLGADEVDTEFDLIATLLGEEPDS